jgi:fimbrial isopeptide formation D2 family protein
MKKTKKLLSIALVLIFAVSLTLIPASAYEITLKEGGVDLTDHNIIVYKVMDVSTFSSVPPTPTSFNYSVTTDWAGFFDEASATTLAPVGAATTLEEYVGSIPEGGASLTTLMEAMFDFASPTSDSPLASVSSITSADATFSSIVTDAGYYFIAVIDPGGDFQPSQSFLLTVIDDVVIDPKIAKPTIEKNIGTITSAQLGGLGTTPTNTKIADAMLGDTIDYEVKISVPDLTMFGGGFVYTLNLVDTLSPGLTLIDDSIKLSSPTSAADDIEDCATVSSVTSAGGGKELTIAFHSDYILGLGEAVELTVTYSVMLTGGATMTSMTSVNLGTDGNTNSALLWYSTNVGDEDASETSVTESTSIYTFKFDIFKFTATPTAASTPKTGLADATFKLYATGTSHTEANAIVFEEGVGGVYVVATEGSVSTTSSLTTIADRKSTRLNSSHI